MEMTAVDDKRENTLKKLAAIKNLPSIPKVVFEVTRLLNDPATATRKLSEVISKDQGLTAKILSVANSPLYGIKRKVSSLEFAVQILGFSDIRNIVTALSLASSIQLSGNQYFDPYEFWLHSMVVGTAAKGLSQDLGFDFGSDVFVAGILHDIGILVAYKFFNSDFIEIVERASSENRPILDVEYDVLGLSHQEIGRFLAEKWELPLTLCDSLSYHHRPGSSEENIFFVSILHLVDYMTQRLRIGDFYWDNNISPDPEMMKALNFPGESDLNIFVDEYAEVFQVTAESIKI